MTNKNKSSSVVQELMNLNSEKFNFLGLVKQSFFQLNLTTQALISFQR